MRPAARQHLLLFLDKFIDAVFIDLVILLA
jgi:hypothetical protein